MTGPNAGGATWVQANNIVLDAADTGGFKINTELDFSNGGADCAVAVRNCYALYIGGIVQNQVFRRYQSQPVDRVNALKLKRWSSQWLYEDLKLFNSYRVRRPPTKVAPAR